MRRPSPAYTHASPDVLSTKTSKNKKDRDGEGQGFYAPRTSRPYDVWRRSSYGGVAPPPVSILPWEYLPHSTSDSSRQTVPVIMGIRRIRLHRSIHIPAKDLSPDRVETGGVLYQRHTPGRTSML